MCDKAGVAWVQWIGFAMFLFLAPSHVMAVGCHPADKPKTLSEKITVLASIEPNSHNSYSLEISERSFVRFEIEQDAPDLVVCIVSPSGAQIRSVQAAFAGEFTTSFAADLPGSYNIVVAYASNQNPDPVTYRLRFETSQLRPVLRVSTVSAEHAFLAGQSLRGALPAASLRSAISQYSLARQKWAATGDIDGEVRALTGAAAVWLDLSDYPRALQAYAEAQRLTSVSPRAWVKILNGRAQVYLDQWDSAAALPYAEEALKLSRILKDPRAEANALVSCGEAHYLQTDDRTARRNIEDALTIARTEGDRVSMARALRVSAWIEEDQGRLHQSTLLMREAEQLFRLTGNIRASINAIGDIATLESIGGDSYLALSNHTDALRLLRKTGQRSGQAFMLEALGSDYLRLKEHDIAAEYFLKALRIFKALHLASGIQDATLELCVSERAMGDLRSALRHCSEAVRLIGKLHDPKREAVSLQNLGMVEGALGRTKAALVLYDRAAYLSRQVSDPRFEAAALVAKGRVKDHEGDPQSAIVLYTRALDLNQDVGAPEVTIDARYEIARSYLSLGRFADAQTQLDQAMLLAEELRSRVGSDSLRTSYFSSIRKCYDLYVEILMERHDSTPVAGFDRMALEKNEAGLARTLLDAITEPGWGLTAETGLVLAAETRRLHRRLAAAYEQRLKLMIGNSSGRALAQNEREISLLGSEYNHAFQTARSGSQSLRPTAPVPTLDQMLRSFQDSDTVVLEYLLGEKRSFVWRIAQGELATYVLPRREIIARDVERYRSLVMARKPMPRETTTAYNARIRWADRQLREQSRHLACEILFPLNSITGNRLVVISDNVLDSLPFAALPRDGCSRKDGPALVTEYEIVKLPSLWLLSALRSRVAQRQGISHGVAVIADPVFSKDDTRVHSQPGGPNNALAASTPLTFVLRDIGWQNSLPRLPGTRREAKAIVATVSPEPTYITLDFEANLATVFSSKLSAYKIVHFATHGLLDPKHPELSGLVFSLVDRRGRDINGYLQVQDIYDLRLKADLIVLSACNSGLGKVVSGEGTMGLTRAFIHAGAPDVLSTLWSIEDEATSELMAHFYHAVLRDGKTPAAALREAQLDILREKRWSHPFYWAGFTLTGDWQ